MENVDNSTRLDGLQENEEEEENNNVIAVVSGVEKIIAYIIAKKQTQI